MSDEKIFSFFGVTTGSSSIMRIFPRWAEHLGLEGVRIDGTDLPIHADPAVYRERVLRLKEDPHELGALVTTHKIDLFRACRDLFDYVDPLAELCGETSCLSKRDGRLQAHAKDPISAGKSLDAFLSDGYWQRSGGEVLCLGAGGSAIAIAVHLLRSRPPADRPRRIIVVNRSQPRLDALREVVEQLDAEVPFEYVRNEEPAANDTIMEGLAPGSLVINATGRGKDTPGSPITDRGRFPLDGIAWELNYRGELDFLQQARAQEEARSLGVHEGWEYFIYGWTAVIEEVFDLSFDDSTIAELTVIAEEARNTATGGGTR
ncbi:MAG: shikimate dehydrogenase [Solirubrobacterales bacterium]